MIDLSKLPKEVQDIIELREERDPTFYRFTESDYTDIWWNILAERANPEVEHAMLSSITGMQGCHAKGTLITTKKGLCEIDKIVAGDEVWSGGKWRPCIPIHQGNKKTIRITLHSGIVLNLTPDHKMKTISGWKCAGELCKGDVLVNGDVAFNPKIDEFFERASIVGMLLADGHMDISKVREKNNYVRISKYKMKRTPKKEYVWNKHRVRFYSKDEELHQYMAKMLVKHYGATATGGYDDLFNGVSRSRVLCIQNKEVCERLAADGVLYGEKSSCISIPDWILENDNAMAGFLAGYFVCDGSYYGETIEIVSVSEKIIRQMHVWLYSRGIIGKVSFKKRNGKNKKVTRLFIRQYESVNDWSEKIPSLLTRKKVIKKKPYVRASKVRCNSTKEWLNRVVSIKEGETVPVFDLHVKDVHEYIANGVVSHNSGKSYSAISMCAFLDPTFSVDNIFFDYNDLVYNRGKLKPNTAVLVDEQSQSFGLDSHRVMIILANLKEQLRKKSIHFFFCSPTLYEESKSSMYLLETMFIDYETRESYACLKTREGLTLGHVRIPHPLNELSDGSSLVTKDFLDAYEAKKDRHLEKVLGNRSQDIFEERAQTVMKNPLFKKVEKKYKRAMGYIPQSTLIQVINKLYPEFHAGVVPVEIAGRIKLDKELTGEWSISGRGRKKK